MQLVQKRKSNNNNIKSSSTKRNAEVPKEKKEKLIENEKNVISFVLLHYCIVLSNKLISFAELLFNIFGKSSQVLVSVKKIVQKVLYSMGIIAPTPRAVPFVDSVLNESRKVSPGPVVVRVVVCLYNSVQ